MTILNSELAALLVTEMKAGDRCQPSEEGIAAGQFTCKRCGAISMTHGVVVWVSKDGKRIKVIRDKTLTPKLYWCGFWDKESNSTLISSADTEEVRHDP